VIFPLLRVHTIFLLVFIHGLDAGVRAARFSRFGSARLSSEFTDLFLVSFPDSGQLLDLVPIFGFAVQSLSLRAQVRTARGSRNHRPDLCLASIFRCRLRACDSPS
jgi:hypothetical protein